MIELPLSGPSMRTVAAIAAAAANGRKTWRPSAKGFWPEWRAMTAIPPASTRKLAAKAASATVIAVGDSHAAPATVSARHRAPAPDM